jgi:adenylate kinase
MNQGQLVPDPLILKMLFERLSQNDCAKGYILDGSPRTLPQAQALQDYFKDKTTPLVINLSLSREKILERLTKRVVCSQCGTPYHLLYALPRVAGICDQCQGPLIHREDDTEAVILKRLQVYQEQTAPLIEFYTNQHLLHTVDCSAEKHAVFNQILALTGL